jgi:transcriptional regulator with XRE-family HTH domain
VTTPPSPDEIRQGIEDRLGDLGAFIRSQREVANMSVRRLAELAKVSNPYLSQIERGLRRPSADILQQLASALKISVEALYVRAGLLQDEDPAPPSVRDAIGRDPKLSAEQKQALLNVYDSFLAGS